MCVIVILTKMLNNFQSNQCIWKELPKNYYRSNELDRMFCKLRMQKEIAHTYHVFTTKLPKRVRKISQLSQKYRLYAL